MGIVRKKTGAEDPHAKLDLFIFSVNKERLGLILKTDYPIKPIV